MTPPNIVEFVTDPQLLGLSISAAQETLLRAIYGLFVLFQFHDYGHLRSKRALLRWGRAILRDLVPPRLAPPDRS